MRIVFQAQYVCCVVRKEETQFMIKLLFFKKRKCSYLNNNSASLRAGSAVSKLKRGGKMQTFLGVVANTRIPYCIWDKPNLLVTTSLCSDSSQYFPNHWYSDESVWRLHFYSLYGQPRFCLIFILSKEKQSFLVWSFTENAFLSPFMKESGQ